MPALEEAFALVPRLRAGDSEAQTEFCRYFEPYIRRTVRLRLRFDDRMRRVLDSVDICQEVLKSFFQRAAAGEYQLDELRQLLALLTTMSRNKLSKQRRYYAADRRNLERTQGIADGDDAILVDRCPSILRVVADQEFLDVLLQRLTDDERQLAQLRMDGQSWSDIATLVGAPADTLRIKLARALERVLRDLDAPAKGV